MLRQQKTYIAYEPKLPSFLVDLWQVISARRRAHMRLLEFVLFSRYCSPLGFLWQRIVLL